jgi:D-3-phosphoglycerate dehydrogenase
MIVVVPDDYPQVLGASPSIERLRAGHEVRYFDSLPGDALVERIGDAEAMINVRSSTRITGDVLARCPRLKLVSIWGTGTDNVDLEAAKARGVRVTNTPAVSAPSIAEHALALMLAVVRRIPQTDRLVREGAWPRGQMMQIAGKTLGIAGLGAIGRRFAELAQGIGMRVIAWTVNPRAASVPLVSIDELLAESDVLSLHLRLSDQTRGWLSAGRIARMKRGAILINTARGSIVDESAMIAALESGQLGGAGLDVFGQEPLPPGHAVTRLDNVVLSPHSAGITPEALEAGLAMAVDNVFAFAEGRAANVVV